MIYFQFVRLARMKTICYGLKSQLYLADQLIIAIHGAIT